MQSSGGVRFVSLRVRNTKSKYLDIRPSHSARLIKIFGRDENGLSRPLCSTVQPLTLGLVVDGCISFTLLGRVLGSAREAARFVSLLSYQREDFVGGQLAQLEQWSHLHTILCRVG
jgi:centrosomal protein CEP76